MDGLTTSLDMKTITIVSLFPEALASYLQTSMMNKAQKVGAVRFDLLDLRRFGVGSRRQVDDTPYGGGDGMVLRVEPLVAAVESVIKTQPKTRVILLTPRGTIFHQAMARQLATDSADLLLLAAHYEGYDERLVNWVDSQISIGDYIVTNGQLPALVLADAVVRLLPSVLGGLTSPLQESFSDNRTVEHPHYTKPAQWRNLAVPEVLLSGDHQAIAGWRRRAAKRPPTRNRRAGDWKLEGNDSASG